MTDIADVRPGDKVRAVYRSEGSEYTVEGKVHIYGGSDALYLFGCCLRLANGRASERLIGDPEVLEPAPPPEPGDDTIVRDKHARHFRKYADRWYKIDGVPWATTWPDLLENKPLDLYRHAGRIEP